MVHVLSTLQASDEFMMRTSTSDMCRMEMNGAFQSQKQKPSCLAFHPFFIMVCVLGTWHLR